MRDLVKILVFGIVLFFVSSVNAQEPYKVLVLPDNIVTETEAVDAYIYNAASEFFAGEVINILNETDYIKSPAVSEERKLLKSNPSYMIPAKNITNRFKTTYNIDYTSLKKIANVSKARYVLLLTTSVDAENYILRRTFWDFLNIPGATVIDPAYKLSTYAVLVDTQNNVAMWSNTFYKTISVCENRIITRGPSPQTEQLQKIRDYSRMLCPEIAQNVQLKVLPPNIYEKETKQIYYDMANFDNVFTKKYRRWAKEGSKDYNATKVKIDNSIENTKTKIDEKKADMQEKAEQRRLKRLEQETQKQQEEQLRVKAEPVNQAQESKKVEPSIQQKNNGILNINLKKKLEDESLYQPLEIKKRKINNLYGEYDPSRPSLRDYN